MKPGLCLGMTVLLPLCAHAGVPGTVFCVSTPAELQAALTTSAGDGVDDFIHIETGTYTGGSAVAFAYSNPNDNTSLTLTGGYAALGPMFPCALFFSDPTLTVLSGSDVRPVLKLIGGPGRSGAISIENLTLRDGNSTNRGAGLEMGQSGTYTGDLRVERVYFDSNLTTTFGGGASVSSDGGTVTVRNNWFRNNRCGSNACAAEVYANFGDTISIRNLVVNNTVVENACSNGAPVTCDTGGIFIGGSGRAQVYDNAFSANGGFDLKLQNGSNVDVLFNNLPALTGTPANSSGNVDLADPGFVDPGNLDYRLKFTSGLRNAGTSGSNGAFDFDGKPRLNDGQYDIGAFENDDAVFKDGFEAVIF